MFTIFLTTEARQNLHDLETDNSLKKRCKAVKKALKHLAQDPRHPGLQTHVYYSLPAAPKGEKIFESYAEQDTPAAYRVFWHYGPHRKKITVIAITSHP